MIPWLASAALAQTIALTAQVDGEHVPVATVQSIGWHALASKDHRALVLPRDLKAADRVMRRAGVEVLLDVDVRWQLDPRATDTGLLAAPFPVIAVTEYALGPDGLEPVSTWSRVAAPVVYESPQLGWYSMPEVALQRAMSAALEPVPGPTSREVQPLLALPIVVSADEEFRQAHPDWQTAVLRRVDRASALLEPAGIRLEVLRMDAWESPDDLVELEPLLRELARSSPSGPALRVGFTGQIRPALAGLAEDVGLAYMPGNTILVTDLPLAGTHPADAEWDVAGEGLVIAHELLHGLGVPHAPHPHLLMSETKRTTVHVLSRSTRELARAAAQARLAHWDPLAAASALAQTAAVRLKDPELQVSYVLENLLAGPGMPAPGQIRPERLSALVHVAMGRYYLAQAHASPQQAHAMHQSALAHGLAALEELPDFVAGREPSDPLSGPWRPGDDTTPWDAEAFTRP